MRTSSTNSRLDTAIGQFLPLAIILHLIHIFRYSPIADVLNTVTESQSVGQYELSGLPKWHTDRVVLIGDAAHVMPPHSGQGASCALEDAGYLSYMLKPFVKLEGSDIDISKVRVVLEAYQAERKPRVYVLLSSPLPTIQLTLVVLWQRKNHVRHT